MKKKLSINSKKKVFIKCLACLIIISYLGIFYSTCFGLAEPELVKKINTALTSIKKWLVKLATPAAGIAIATGVLMRKFSFGDEEKMVRGKKVIINAIVCYAIVISIDLIIKFVKAVI